jgi:hypothetical protein
VDAAHRAQHPPAIAQLDRDLAVRRAGTGAEAAARLNAWHAQVGDVGGSWRLSSRLESSMVSSVVARLGVAAVSSPGRAVAGVAANCSTCAQYPAAASRHGLPPALARPSISAAATSSGQA